MPDASRAASRSDDFLPENVGIGTIFLALKAFTDLNGLIGLNGRPPSRPMGRSLRVSSLSQKVSRLALSRLMSSS